MKFVGRLLLVLGCVLLTQADHNPNHINVKYDLTGSLDCATKKPICIEESFVYRTPSSTLGKGLSLEPQIPTNAAGGWGKCNNYKKEVNPMWMTVSPIRNGDITFDLVSYAENDLDFIIWGPFDTPAEGCGAALNPAKEVSCGWQRGPTLPAYASVAPFSFEHAKIPNAVKGKYYVMLINDEGEDTDVAGPPGNSTFQMLPTGNSSGSTDCLFLTEVLSFSISGTGNQTAHGTMPMVGTTTNITFTGVFLDSNPYKDAAKTVAAGDTCDGPSVGADRVGEDLGPGDVSQTNTTIWSFSFLTGGNYTLCYKVSYGPNAGQWKQLGTTFFVGDNRPVPPTKPPGAIPDAIATNNDYWFDFEPKLVVKGGVVEYTFSGFEPFGYRDEEATCGGGPEAGEIEVKVVVQSCQESTPSVPGLVPQKLTNRRTAKFSLGEVGRYKLCIKHRKVWETSQHFLQVTTPDSLQVYRSYTSCEQLLDVEPQYCGCFFSHNATAAPGSAVIPTDFPMTAIMAGTGLPMINQGCCSMASKTRETISHPTKIWGLCSN
mmetsp:Transcript_118887/g.207083  ORF Transcript_118887/g.207083 Transcript_118887/m.207083 type:complete len:544 (-) Transcript_118887:191-1822(-)